MVEGGCVRVDCGGIRVVLDKGDVSQEEDGGEDLEDEDLVVLGPPEEFHGLPHVGKVAGVVFRACVVAFLSVFCEVGKGVWGGRGEEERCGELFLGEEVVKDVEGAFAVGPCGDAGALEEVVLDRGADGFE